MRRKISEETRAEIQRLYDGGRGMSPTEIARQIGVPYQNVYSHTRGKHLAKERGFESRAAYEEHLAKERGFESLTAYREHLAKERGFESRAAYEEHLAKERGFESLTAYREHLAKERGFESLTAYREHLAKERGFESLTAYREHLAKERGFESLSDYQKHLAKERGFESRAAYEEHLAKERGFESLTAYREHLAKRNAKRKLNRELSDFVTRRLEWMGLNQNWLAKETGVSRQMISLYCQGKAIPQGENLKKLLRALDIKRSTKLPKSLEDLIEEGDLEIH